MGVFDRFERGVERAFKGTFAKAFKSQVQPVEIAQAIRHAMDDKAAVLGPGRTMVPNLFTVELSPSDHEQLIGFQDPLIDELCASAEEHAESQRYTPSGPLSVRIDRDDALDTGVFRLRPASGAHFPAQQQWSQDYDQGGYDYDADHSFGAQGGYDADQSYGESYGDQGFGDQGFGDQGYGDQGYGAGGYAQPDPYAVAPSAPGPLPSPAGPYAGAGAAYAGQPPAYPGPAQPPQSPPQSPLPQQRQPWAQQPPHQAPQRTQQRPDVPPTTVQPTRPPQTTAAQRPYLELDGQRYPLLSALTVIGRDSNAQIILDDPGVSRRHAELRVTHDGPHLVASIRDLGSTNGTFVNGETTHTRRLREGDRITVGRAQLTFHMTGSSRR